MRVYWRSAVNLESGFVGGPFECKGIIGGLFWVCWGSVVGLLEGTVPNMTLQVTSKSTKFSVKIKKIWKNSINVLTSFLMRAQPFFLLNMSKKMKKNLSNHCWYFFSLSRKFMLIPFLMVLAICREFWGQNWDLCIKIDVKVLWKIRINISM